MYDCGYGIIETLAPLHVGATAGEERGNLNLIFRDQFVSTGIVPGSSLRGRLRADLFQKTYWNALESKDDPDSEAATKEVNNLAEAAAGEWYGRAAESRRQDNFKYESLIKFAYASVVWLPVFCPGQPVVWVSCPYLLERYKRIVGITTDIPKPYTGSKTLKGRRKKKQGKEVLFFNLGFLTIEQPQMDLSAWLPEGKKDLPAVVVGDREMGAIHDMALYRQSRVALDPHQKIVADKAFFNVEALPHGTILVFPVTLKPGSKKWEDWRPLENDKTGDIYLGGLESVGFGHCFVQIHRVKEAAKS